MSCILTVIESKNKEIKNSALELLSEARKISSKKNLDNKVIIIGEYEKNNSTQINEFGINSLLIGSTDKISKYSPELYRDSLLHTINELKPEIILFSGSSIGKDLAPRIAANIGYNLVTECIDISIVEDGYEIKRPIFAGKIIQTLRFSKTPIVVSLKSNSFAIEKIEAVPCPALAEFLGQELTPSERPELTSAGIVISGGRGMQSGDNFAMLERIADKLGAAVGASRAAVDAGYVPNDYQVGQTGKVVAPNLYIAVGISGAIQHLAGMKDSKVIVAINKDEEAPIFQIADYGWVADLFTAIPELEAALDADP